jgi:hypothetical protein
MAVFFRWAYFAVFLPAGVKCNVYSTVFHGNHAEISVDFATLDVKTHLEDGIQFGTPSTAGICCCCGDSTAQCIRFHMQLIMFRIWLLHIFSSISDLAQ